MKLLERTTLISGPCHRVTQFVAIHLTSLGGDVALLNEDPLSERFTLQLMDQREVNEKFGRAITVPTQLDSKTSLTDGVARVAESFGGIDAYIDANMFHHVGLVSEELKIDEIDRLIQTNLRSPLCLTQSILKYMEGRKRGSIIYLVHDLLRWGHPGLSLEASTRLGLIGLTRGLARELGYGNITVNCVGIGLTEEYLLKIYPEMTLREAEKRFQQEIPGIRLTSLDKIAELVAFLIGSGGTGVTGQYVSAGSLTL